MLDWPRRCGAGLWSSMAAAARGSSTYDACVLHLSKALRSMTVHLWFAGLCSGVARTPSRPSPCHMLRFLVRLGDSPCRRRSILAFSHPPSFVSPVNAPVLFGIYPTRPGFLIDCVLRFFCFSCSTFSILRMWICSWTWCLRAIVWELQLRPFHICSYFHLSRFHLLAIYF